MTAMRQLVGEVLRARRISQGLTLRDVSGKARVSLGYISEPAPSSSPPWPVPSRCRCRRCCST
jgi:transcriptional regulator with XRE-family HTH domain